MHISEVLSEESTGERCSNERLVSKIEKRVQQMEQILPMISPENTTKLRDYMMRLAPCKAVLSEGQKLQLWKVSYRLWNACVDMANTMHTGQQVDEEHAKLRQLASDLLLTAGQVEGIQSGMLKTATFFHRTGIIWHKLRKYELAAACFEKATELSSKEKIFPEGEEGKFLFELHIARAKTAWEMCQRTLTCTFLGRAKGLLFDIAERYRDLAEQCLFYGKSILAKPEDGCNQGDSIKFLDQAFEICAEGLSNSLGKAEERLLLENIKLRALRYLAAGHLQSENFESVLKCAAVLRDCSDHPTTPFLALKAYLGLGVRDEAERELTALLGHSGAPIDICISAVEIFIQSGGGGLETAKSAFFRLHSRFPCSRELPVRVLDKILRNISSNDQNYKAKVALALQIASNERIISLLDDQSANERRCVHAILWNSGSEFFRAKDYDTSIGLFEGSMLYIPFDADNNNRRAKCLRVLCLCHLGLSQYDRADEYITEAEKLEPNIVCIFLKTPTSVTEATVCWQFQFKIFLQLKDEARATKQLERMLHCIDFDPEYLTLASHEAIACKSVGVATVALSNLLKLHSSGTPAISTKEVVVIRNIILLHMEDPNAQSEVLKYLKYAKKRMQEAGLDQFFGSGMIGERELNWFAGTSWNNGLKAGKSNKFDVCAEFFICASEFYGAVEDSTDNLKMLLKSLILSVAAMLAKSQNKGDDCLKEVVLHLEKAGKVQASLASKQDTADECFEIYCALLNFESRGRLKDHKLQLEILNHCRSLKGCKPEFLLKMGLHACEGEYGNAEVASVALNACLNMLLSSPYPDYRVVSLVIRKLIGIADAKGEEEEIVGMYKQAHQIIIGMKSGEYPIEEAKWLVSTAWNRSGIHVRFSRFDEAEMWMRMGLDLLKHVPSMLLSKPSMTECLAQVINLKGCPRQLNE
eukprot:Gb_10795 [translate_table: standard]